MQASHAILELPRQRDEFDELVSQRQDEIRDVRFSTAEVEGAVRHYVLVLFRQGAPASVTF